MGALTLASSSCSHSRCRLDEMDREEFFRLKKVQGKKKKDTALREAEAKDKREKMQEQGQSDEPGENLLQDKDDDGESVGSSVLASRHKRRQVAETSRLLPILSAVIF